MARCEHIDRRQYNCRHCRRRICSRCEREHRNGFQHLAAAVAAFKERAADGQNLRP